MLHLYPVTRENKKPKRTALKKTEFYFEFEFAFNNDFSKLVLPELSFGAGQGQGVVGSLHARLLNLILKIPRNTLLYKSPAVVEFIELLCIVTDSNQKNEGNQAIDTKFCGIWKDRPNEPVLFRVININCNRGAAASKRFS